MLQRKGRELMGGRKTPLLLRTKRPFPEGERRRWLHFAPPHPQRVWSAAERGGICFLASQAETVSSQPSKAEAKALLSRPFGRLFLGIEEYCKREITRQAKGPPTVSLWRSAFLYPFQQRQGPLWSNATILSQSRYQCLHRGKSCLNEFPSYGHLKP